MAKGRKTGGRDFKLGQCGNPGGKRKTPEHIKKLRALTHEELKVCGDLIVLGTSLDLERILADPASTNLLKWIASVAKKGIARGDMTSLNELLNRLIGKVTDKIEASHHHWIDQIKRIEAMSNEELIQSTQEALAVLKGEGAT